MYNPAHNHRHSIRLKGYDYSQAGLYFITLCCQDRANLFGKITDGNMILNQFRQIAHDEWSKTPQIRPNVELGEFVIMPNHIHGIIHIVYSRGELHSPDSSGGEFNSPQPRKDEFNSPQPRAGEFNSSGEGESNSSRVGEFHSPQRTIGAIVRGYKSAVTKQLNELNIGCRVWQRNYYEHIIRDETAHTHISNYIINNPCKWNEDSLK